MDQINKPKTRDWPHYGEDEIDAVVEVLRSGRVNQWGGCYVHQFQEELAKRIGVPHVIAVSNGSQALDLALRAFGIGPGDEVIVTSRSFIASASCVSIAGAQPLFADVDRDSGNITVETIAPHLSERTKAIIPVHLAGWPCDMPAIMKLAKQRDLVVIEDCAQAIGATIDGQSVGSFGDAGAFSFCKDKIISTGGEGGALCLNNADVWSKAWSYKDHGKDWQLAHHTDTTPWFKWLHNSIGTNLRMTEMQAAIGVKQLGKLDAWLDQRREFAMIWYENLASCDALRIPRPPKNTRHACYRFYAYLKPEMLRKGVTNKTVLLELQKADVVAQSGACPEIYLEKAFANDEVSPRDVAAELARTSLAFPIHPMLDKDDISNQAKLAADVINSFVDS